ncbi:MAG: hypothetical protein J6Y62_07160 [Clostridia bacterium]|nr:hypothetical protein [Clostridia bacterium]
MGVFAFSLLLVLSSVAVVSLFHRMLDWLFMKFSRRPFRCGLCSRTHDFPQGDAFVKWFMRHLGPCGKLKGFHHQMTRKGWAWCAGWKVPVVYEIDWNDRRSWTMASVDIPPLEDDQLTEVEKHLLLKSLSIVNSEIDPSDMDALIFKIENALEEFDRKA